VLASRTRPGPAEKKRPITNLAVIKSRFLKRTGAAFYHGDCDHYRFLPLHSNHKTRSKADKFGTLLLDQY